MTSRAMSASSPTRSAATSPRRVQIDARSRAPRRARCRAPGTRPACREHVAGAAARHRGFPWIPTRPSGIPDHTARAFQDDGGRWRRSANSRTSHGHAGRVPGARHRARRGALLERLSARRRRRRRRGTRRRGGAHRRATSSRPFPRRSRGSMATAVEIVSTSAEATEAAGERLGLTLGPGAVVALTGELGAGKTCFVQGAGARSPRDSRARRVDVRPRQPVPGPPPRLSRRRLSDRHHDRAHRSGLSI